MNALHWFDLLEHAADTVRMVCGLAFAARLLIRMAGRPVPSIVSIVFFELRPFFLPSVLIGESIQMSTGEWTWVDALFAGISIFNWFMMRQDEDDDDRWKRRREKLAAKVEEVGGKLTVVPVGSPA